MDEELIRAFVDDGYGRAVAAVALVCGDRHRAEDAVQEALVRAWERDGDVDSLPAWVTVVAMNRARSGLRRRGAEQRAYARLAAVSSNGAAMPPGDPADARVAAALAALPRRQREAAVLHYYLDLSVERVAELLDVSEGTVKTCLHRARAALRAALGSAEEVSRERA